MAAFLCEKEQKTEIQRVVGEESDVKEESEKYESEEEDSENITENEQSMQKNEMLLKEMVRDIGVEKDM